jgi:hypothetical protein
MSKSGFNARNQQQITVEHKGRILRGTYIVWRGTITLSSGLARTTALIGGILPESLARSMLRELADDGKI